jgi:hypothetical protein
MNRQRMKIAQELREVAARLSVRRREQRQADQSQDAEGSNQTQSGTR